MTQTFSQILEEKLITQTSGFEKIPAVFYSGTAEASCFFMVLNIRNIPRPGNYLSTTSTEIEDYSLSPVQTQAMEFLNNHLPKAKKMNGHFSLWRLRKTYLTLAKQFHPDLGGSPELFRELHTQYKILLDFLSPIK